jgi:preprotein translocase subunit SecE
MSNSPKKTVWSLQDNKRTEDQRNAFKPTGKKPRNKTLQYILVAILVLFVVSFLLLQIYEETLETCIIDAFCINSKEDVLLYTLYVFLNILIVVLAIVGAYAIGRKLALYIKV